MCGDATWQVLSHAAMSQRDQVGPAWKKQGFRLERADLSSARSPGEKEREGEGPETQKGIIAGVGVGMEASGG